MPPRSRSPSPENDVFAISTTLVPERKPKIAGTTSRDFDGRLQPPLLLQEDLQPGCGGQLWPAGIVLATYLLQNQQANLLRNRTVVELGAGVGLVGLALALGLSQQQSRDATVCLPRILITDQQPLLALMQKNIILNKLSDTVSAGIYDWGGTVPASVRNSSLSKFPDVVLAADCVYFEPAFPLLLQTLADLLGPDTVCWFCFKKRRKADMRFVRDLRKQFNVVECDYQDKEKEREGIYLFKVSLRKQNQTSE